MWDADHLVNSDEDCAGMNRSQLGEYVEKTFRTDTGKKLAEEKIRYGLRRKLNVKGYWSGFHDSFWEAKGGFTQGVRKAAGDVDMIDMWEKKTGKTYEVAVAVGRV